MSLKLAQRIIDFAFENTPVSEDVDIGFFGGEPLLEFPLLQDVVSVIEQHTAFSPSRVKLSVVTNGTLVTPEIARYLAEHSVALQISCDGPPAVHDTFRHFADGQGSSAMVERGIQAGLAVFGLISVNAVYRPETLARLPETVEYLSSLGIRQIYLNPDFSAPWTPLDVELVPAVYSLVADRYMQYYREGRPHFISLIDGKIALLLRGGYHPSERCRMGEGEFAFTPSGRVYPCERLAGGDPGRHAIGSVSHLVDIGPVTTHAAAGPSVNTPCLSCSLHEYCMNWCGCSNYFMTGFYNRVGPFLCASERACIEIAWRVFETIEAELGPTFADHLGGRPMTRSVCLAEGADRPA
jgi:uncharacterized protein